MPVLAYRRAISEREKGVIAFAQAFDFRREFWLAAYDGSALEFAATQSSKVLPAEPAVRRLRMTCGIRTRSGEVEKTMQTGRFWVRVAVVSPLLLFSAGCRILKGPHKEVSIDTPVGGLDVKRDTAAVLTKVGLPAYPGAHPVASSETNSDSADVNLSFGGFQLQVLATGLETGDEPSRIEAFYRKALAQYSDVIACRDGQAVDAATKTGMGLTCSDSDRNRKWVHVHATDHERDDLELKAGSPTHQHIVVLKPQKGATRIELVSLVLPNGSENGE